MGVRVIFHALAACASVGVVVTLLVAGRVSGGPLDPTLIMILVPVSGMTSLSGLWAGALAILEPPALTATDRRIGHGVLVALTVTGPVSMMLVGRVG